MVRKKGKLTQQRTLDNVLKLRLPIEIDKRLSQNNVDKTCLINIFTPPDAEAVNFGNQIKDFLILKTILPSFSQR